MKLEKKFFKNILMLNKNIKKILVIKHGSLGDIVFALEAMFSIRNHSRSYTYITFF